MDWLEKKSPLYRNLFAICLLGLGTMAYAIVFRSCRHLPLSAFEGNWISPNAAIAKWGTVVLIGAVLTLVASRNLSWRQIDSSRGIRWIVFSAVAILTWSFVVYDYNFFYEQSHVVDRTLLFLLAIAFVWRPAFCGFYVFQLGCLMGQLSAPLSLSWTDKAVPIDTLLLAQVFLTVCCFFRLRVQHFLVALLFVVSVHYFRPAAGKIGLNWIGENNLSPLYLSAVFQNGWTGFVDHSRVPMVASVIHSTSKISMLATLVIEILPITFLFNRKFTLWLLWATISLHLGIFISSGILFWKWIVVNGAIIFVISKVSQRRIEPLFGNRQGAVFACFAILGSFFYSTAPVLAWLDAPIAVRYHLEVVGESDEVYQIPPFRLAPYDLQFAQGRLGFLDGEPMLVDCLGTCFSDEALGACRTVESIEDLREARIAFGTPRTGAGTLKGLVRLLRHYVRATPNERSRFVWDFMPDPPQHIWTHAVPLDDQPIWDWQEKPRRIRIRRQTAVHGPDSSRRIEDSVLLDFEA